MVTQKLTIRLDETELPEIRMVSGDVGREIQIEVYAREDSENPIDLETYSAEITLIKPDNTFIMDNFTVDKYELPENAGAVSGSGYYQIKIFTAGSHQIYTGQGRFLVDDMILSDDVIESSSIAFGDRFPEDFATKTWVDDEIEAAGIGTYVAGNPAGEETMPPLVRLQINDDIYPISHKIEEMEDADITTPADGDVLTYDADDQKWKNEPLDIPDPTVTKTATGNPIEISDGANAPLVKCVTQITGYQSGSGTPSPDNICPITAYTEGEIEVVGKNLASTAVYKSDYVIGASGETPSPSYFISEPVIIDPNKSYYLSSTRISSGTDSVRIGFYDDEMQFISRFIGESELVTPIPSNTRYVKFSYRIVTPQLKDVQFEIGISPTTYEPYTSTTHTTTYPNAIYRGSEDVVNGSVETEWKSVDLGSLTWTRYGNPTTYGELYYTDDLNGEIAHGSQTLIYTACSIYESVPNEQNGAKGDPNEFRDGCVRVRNNDGCIYVRDDRWSSSSDFITAVTGQTLAYELATPTTSPVTPTNLPIKSLSGYSHIESSTGDMEVEYITQTYDAIMQATQLDNLKVYSTAEQVVGKWVDGSDIYERTIDIGSFSVSSWEDHTIESSTNINLLIDYAGYMVESNIIYALPDPSVRIKVDASHNLIFTGTSSWNVTSGYITIRYIKL